MIPSSASARRLTEFLLSDIVAISADAIICVDADQKITLFNDGAEQIFGWKAEEVMGKPLDILLPERVRAIHSSHIERFRDAPEHARKMGQRREISGLRKNGEEFPAEAAIAKVTMGDSVVFSVVLRDITEQVELQRKLQRAVQARDDTVGVVAHDLRNPVSAVKMLSGALLQRDDIETLPPEASEHLRLIRASALQMDRLIQDLLDITRIDTGRLAVDPVPIEVGELLEGALGTLRPLVKDAGLQLVENVAATVPHVRADAERIAQVLSNLVGNAIKFTPRGGAITVSAIADGGFVRISVSDTGVGIPKDQQPHVFDRFWQSTQSTIRSRGAGLGLPIASGIVRAHGGSMGVDSEPGRGSTFYFTLPVAS
ncbi:MAG TPA: PAS domain-containing sensor histidine kinase [Gemmatimonadaceae bacterium]|nr:PAS domain-containing sensor histidine kinase [Gemmatimonadaceae bacterium]